MFILVIKCPRRGTRLRRGHGIGGRDTTRREQHSLSGETRKEVYRYLRNETNFRFCCRSCRALVVRNTSTQLWNGIVCSLRAIIRTQRPCVQGKRTHRRFRTTRRGQPNMLSQLESERTLTEVYKCTSMLWGTSIPVY